MANVVVVGSQWGDEGKGKIVDWLSEQADIVVRFQGGHNAGHTLVIDGVTYKLSLLPSGVVRGGKLSVIGNGVVVDPQALLDEIATAQEAGRRGHAGQSAHRRERAADPAAASELDAVREADEFGDTRIGTTKRGIGPAYEDKVGRRAIRLMDLADLPALGAQDRAAAGASQCAAPRPRPRRDRRRRRSTTISRRSRRKVLPYMDSVWSLLDAKRREGKRILFEGAQGALLDIDHGTYPYVTSSNTVAAQAATGSGLGPERDRLRARHLQGLHHAGRRGAVPDRADDNEIGKTLGERGREFGTVTGRAAPLRLVRRRAGAPDRAHLRHRRHRAHQARHSRRLRRDQGLRRLSPRRPRNRLSSGRRAGAGAGRAGLRDHRRAGRSRPRGARSWAQLPAQAIKYVRRIEELIGCPVALLSTSPEREDTILMKNPFETMIAETDTKQGNVDIQWLIIIR